MYYGLTFPRAKQYKTIHDELISTYLLPDIEIGWNTKSTLWRESKRINFYKQNESFHGK